MFDRDEGDDLRGHNRTSSDFLEAVERLLGHDYHLSIGGPADDDSFELLVRRSGGPTAGLEIANDVLWRGTNDDLARIADQIRAVMRP